MSGLSRAKTVATTIQADVVAILFVERCSLLGCCGNASGSGGRGRVVVIVIRRRNEGLGREVASMTSGATDWRASVLKLADVIRVDTVDHLDHQAGGGFFGLRVIGEVEHGASVGTLFDRVGGVAGGALSAQSGFPLVHDLVHLLAGECLGQNLEVGGRGRGSMFVGLRAGRCG